MIDQELWDIMQERQHNPTWIASLSLSRWSGLLIPISRWISVSERADMMAPDLTLARHAATYLKEWIKLSPVLYRRRKNLVVLNSPTTNS